MIQRASSGLAWRGGASGSAWLNRQPAFNVLVRSNERDIEIRLVLLFLDARVVCKINGLRDECRKRGDANLRSVVGDAKEFCGASLGFSNHKIKRGNLLR